MILSDQDLDYFGYRIAQLVGVSTSEDGRGLIGIFGQSSYDLEILQRKCLVVLLAKKGDIQGQRNLSVQLREMRIPFVQTELQSATYHPAEIFKWEIATALACVPLALNPFHDGDFGGSMAIPRERLENMTGDRDSLRPVPRVK